MPRSQWNLILLFYLFDMKYDETLQQKILFVQHKSLHVAELRIKVPFSMCLLRVEKFFRSSFFSVKKFILPKWWWIYLRHDYEERLF